MIEHDLGEGHAENSQRWAEAILARSRWATTDERAEYRPVLCRCRCFAECVLRLEEAAADDSSEPRCVASSQTPPHAIAI